MNVDRALWRRACPPGGRRTWGFPGEKGMSRTSVIRLLVIVLVGAGLGVLVYYSPAFFIKDDAPPPYAHLNTGGTSVVSFLLENKWRGVYRKEKEVEVDYDSTGSTQGVTQMIEKKYAVGFTHAPMTEDQRKEARGRGGEVVQIPVVICAVVPIYNVKELKDKPPVQFTGEVLADIFLGKIDRWNNPALQKLNEGVALPDTKITVVHREDSSGTTFIFTDYLHGASAAWRKEVGAAGSKVKWPAGTGVARNHGVADTVYRTEGAIGYVDLLYASYGDGQLRHGAVRNKDDSAFIHAESEKMTAALSGLIDAIPDDLTFGLTNKPGKDSYPICGAVWAVCYQDQPAADQKRVADFLHWVTHEGQKYAKNMSYAPLPEKLVRRVDEKIKSIKVAR
jgi:phosphate transport system substrate-binding protein